MRLRSKTKTFEFLLIAIVPLTTNDDSNNGIKTINDDDFFLYDPTINSRKHMLKQFAHPVCEFPLSLPFDIVNYVEYGFHCSMPFDGRFIYSSSI